MNTDILETDSEVNISSESRNANSSAHRLLHDCMFEDDSHKPFLQVGDLIRQQELEAADLGGDALAATTEEPLKAFQAAPDSKATFQQVSPCVTT